MGQVLQAGAGQIPARQAAVQGGIRMTVPALTVNKVCLSGLNAVALADQLIRAGECDVVVAGGMESMTRAPHLLPGSRAGFKYGDVDAASTTWPYDGLWDAFTDQAMGALTEACNTGDVAGQPGGPGRLRRPVPPAGARGQPVGVLAAEIVAGPGAAAARRRRRGRPPTRGSGRRHRPSRWAGCGRPSAADGTITAGSSSPISDGAAAVVVASRAAAERLGLTPIWPRSGRTGRWPGPTPRCSCSPPPRSSRACKKQGIAVADLDLIEINEAFAAVGVASARALGLTAAEIDERVNVHGGAIALGHPIGASGARLVLHLAYELQPPRRRHRRRGAVRRRRPGRRAAPDACPTRLTPSRDRVAASR